MDKYEALKQYKELLESEIITQKEFDAKKKELLALPDDIDVKKDSSIEKKIKDAKKKANGIKETVSIKSNEMQNVVSEKVEKSSKSITEKKAEREEKKKNKVPLFKRKGIKIALIVIGIIIALFIALVIVGNAMLTDLSEDMAKTQKSSIRQMSYEIPQNWEKDEDSSTDIKERFLRKNEKGELLSFLEVSYIGDTDLEGDAGVPDEHPLVDDYDKVLPNSEGYYWTNEADNSEFEVMIYIVPNTVKGEEKLIESIAQTMDVDGYKNPRKSLGIEASYEGSTEENVVLDNDNDGFVVGETFDTGINKGIKEIEWSIDKPKTLKAGETCTVTINTEKKEITLKIKCTTATIGQRNALDKAESYLSSMGFSKEGLREQLDFEGFNNSEIDYAIENCSANWKEECVEKAESYLDAMSFSRSGLYDQLAYEGFTGDQIEYALDKVY